MLIDDLKKKDNFSNTEKSIAELILDRGLEIEQMTIRDLAKNIYSNPSSFIRLAHKLGFSGWNELKNQYLQEVRYLLSQKNIDVNIPFNSRDSSAEIAIKVTQTKIAAMQETLKLIDNKKLKKFVQTLYDANKIVIFAHSVNLLLAQEFQFKMKRIKRSVIISNLPNEQTYDVLNMSQNDCALIISYSGDGFDDVVSLLNRRSIPTVAITGLTNNPLSKSVTNSLSITTRERLYSQVGNYSTNTSISLLLDIIYSEIFARDFSKNYAHIVNTGKIANVRNLEDQK